MIIDYNKKNSKVNTHKMVIINLFYALGGALLFAASLNLLILPLKFFNGGLLGIAQLIRSFLTEFLKLNLPKSIDISGIIYYIMNIPMLYLAYKSLGKVFFYRTIILTTLFTFMLSFIRIPEVPIINDPLTASIVGGVLCGFGAGYILRAGYSAGGQDILGIYLTKKYRDFSVGKLGLIINIIVFGICAILYNFEVVVYSFIFNTVTVLALDKVHIQNINVLVTIFTKSEGLPEVLLPTMVRGITSWKGVGEYTKDGINVYSMVINKYEIEKMTALVLSKDPRAFIITQEGAKIQGNFEKRL